MCSVSLAAACLPGDRANHRSGPAGAQRTSIRSGEDEYARVQESGDKFFWGAIFEARALVMLTK